MKLKRIIVTATVIILIVVIIAARLASNKRSFNEQLKMASEFNTAIPVITDTAKYEEISTEFSENGTFKAMHEVSIIAETQGKVVSIVCETGDHVRAGQLLASADNELFRSQLDQAEFNLEKAEKDMHRYEQLSKGDAATAQQYELAWQTYVNAKAAFTAARIQYNNTFIKAPFDGSITKQYIEKGTYLLPGVPVFDMVGINKVKFIARLTAEEANEVKEGQHVRVTADAFSGITYDGVMSAVVIKANDSRRYDAEIDVINHQDNVIKPGMFGTAVFTGRSGNRFLVIPRKAIAGSIKSPEVFIVKGDSVVLQSVNAVSLDDKHVIVKQGLNAGDVIVTSGQINLVNGSKITLNN